MEVSVVGSAKLQFRFAEIDGKVGNFVMHLRLLFRLILKNFTHESFFLSLSPHLFFSEMWDVYAWKGLLNFGDRRKQHMLWSLADNREFPSSPSNTLLSNAQPLLPPPSSPPVALRVNNSGKKHGLALLRSQLWVQKYCFLSTFPSWIHIHLPY